MTDQSSPSHPQPLQTHETPSLMAALTAERPNFALTEAQRIFIQHYLPKKFTLLPVTGCLRKVGSSMALLEDSLTFIERKRGRPEGSTRKHIFSKPSRERKSLRIANVARPNYHALQEHSNPDSPSNSLEQDARRNQSGREEEAQPAQEGQEKVEKDCVDVSLEEGLRKVPEKVDVPVDVVKEEDLLEKQAQVKQEVNENPPSCSSEKHAGKQAPRRLSRKKSQKAAVVQGNPPIPQGEILQTPTQKAEELQEFVKELKTEPSSKGLAEQLSRFDWERTILRRLKSHKEIFPFLEPVDEARDGAPGYYQAISSPIDLQTIEFKLKTGIYKIAEEFHADVRLMWANAKSYNRRNEFMQQVTEELEGFYLHLLTRPRCGRKKKQP